MWLALAGVVGLQFLVVQWSLAQSVFRTTALAPADWWRAILIASSVLLLEEARKGFQRMWCRLVRLPTN